MAILTLQRRLREAGRIRIGQQVKTSNGKTRPAKLEAFRLTSSDKVAIDAAAQLYGGEPHEWDGAQVGKQWEVFTTVDALPVVVPPAATAFSQFYETWSGGGCTRRCDGERELLTDAPCLCAGEDEPSCKPTTRVSVILQELPGLGVWRLESHGYYAATELAGTIETIMFAYTRGQLLPAVLRLEQRQVKRAGEAVRKFAVPILDVQLTPQALGLVLGGGPGLAGELPGRAEALPQSWQPIPQPMAELDAGPGDVGDAIRDARTPTPKRRKNSPPELPPTGVRPRPAAAVQQPELNTEPTDDEPLRLSDAQMKKLRALYGSVGITGAGEQKKITARLLGVDTIPTHSALTVEQASRVIDLLSKVETDEASFVLDEDGQVTGIEVQQQGDPT